MVAWPRKGFERIPTGAGKDLLLFQLGYLPEPSETAAEAAFRGMVKVWDAKKNKMSFKGVSYQPGLDLNNNFFAHATDVKSAVKALLDGAWSPSTKETCKEPVCGLPGVYFIQLFSMEVEDILAVWQRLITGGYNGGAMLIAQLVGVPVAGNYNLKIEPGMIATKKGSGDLRQIAAHVECIAYKSIVFDEDLLVTCTFMGHYMLQN